MFEFLVYACDHVGVCTFIYHIQIYFYLFVVWQHTECSGKAL